MSLPAFYTLITGSTNLLLDLRCRLLHGASILLHFQPHGVQNTKHGGKWQSEKPGKVPHDISFPVRAFPAKVYRGFAFGNA
jgi:hypothetical protein